MPSNYLILLEAPTSSDFILNETVLNQLSILFIIL